MVRDSAWLNDDRVGRALVSLFDADRASLLTEPIVGVAAWKSLSYSKQKAHALSVSSARTEETQQRRLTEVLESLRA